ncbi:MAG: hypothetical protein SFX73_30320 [Kofleriaceae bacterium]|nr:hypothetical protein [Kofleriaceae bacterium]
MIRVQTEREQARQFLGDGGRDVVQCRAPRMDRLAVRRAPGVRHEQYMQQHHALRDEAEARDHREA